MPRELFLLQQLLGASGSSWISVALMIALFTILAFRPERVHRHGMFRLACGLLALSIAVPPLMTFAAMFSLETYLSLGPSSGRMGQGTWLLQLAQACGPMLAGGGVFCGLWSLLPVESHTGFVRPTRHPLE